MVVFVSHAVPNRNGRRRNTDVKFKFIKMLQDGTLIQSFLAQLQSRMMDCSLFSEWISASSSSVLSQLG